MKARAVRHFHDLKKPGQYTFIDSKIMLLICPSCGREIGIRLMEPNFDMLTAQAVYALTSKLTFNHVLQCPMCSIRFVVKKGIIDILPGKETLRITEI